MKVAGSSIEKGLISFCNSSSLCTGGSSIPLVPGKTYSQKEISESAEYNQINNHFLNGQKKFEVRFHAHTDPEMFFSKIKNVSAFEDFKCITAVRNPWDVTVSFYWWSMISNSQWPEEFRIKEGDSEKLARKKFRKWLTCNAVFHGHSSTALVKSSPLERISRVNSKFVDDRIDDYIVYERGLNEEYRRIFQPIIQDAWLVELPRLKTKVKKIKKHYSFYYDKYSRGLTGELNRDLIKKFNYKYEKHNGNH